MSIETYVKLVHHAKYIYQLTYGNKILFMESIFLDQQDKTHTLKTNIVLANIHRARYVLRFGLKQWQRKDIKRAAFYLARWKGIGGHS